MMIATVLSGDLDVVAQSAPKTRTRFVEVDLDSALAARSDHRKRSRRLAEALGG
jgi:allophanate hydrolase subunit 2